MASMWRVRFVVQYFYIAIFVSCVPFGHIYATDHSQIVDDSARINQVLEPSMRAFVQAIFDLVPYSSSNAHIVRDTEWQELDCDLMVQKLDRTKTIFGFWGLKKLSLPIADGHEIIRRQTLIKKLVFEHDFREKLEFLLDSLKTTEREVVAYWNKHDQLNESSRKLYYSIWSPYTDSFDRYLNRSRIALEGSSVFGMAKAASVLACGLGLRGITDEIYASSTAGRDISLSRGLLNGGLAPLRANIPWRSVCADGYSPDKFPDISARGSGGDYFTLLNTQIPSPLAGLVAVGFACAVDLNIYSSIRSLIDQWKESYGTTNKVQVRMVQIAKFFRSIDLLHDLMQSNADIFDQKSIELLSFKHASVSLKKLKVLLKTATFDQPSSSWYSRGNVLLAHQLMNDLKKELIPLLHVIAQIDGYYSIARLFREQDTTCAPFCFVEFVQDEVPVLKCQDCWTPLIPIVNPVLNSFDWNKNTHTKIVLTGPNGSGKSTVMKSIAHNIILAQSWGISTARKMTMRIFTGLRSSLSPREDLQQNLSTFMAEKRRIDDIYEYIAQQDRNSCCFVLLDEPYRGTVEAEAAYRINMFAHQIIPTTHCMMIMATHLQGPTLLANQTNDIFANYQLELKESSEGKFIRTFKLLPGVAQWWFDDVLKRRRFVDQLLQIQPI